MLQSHTLAGMLDPNATVRRQMGAPSFETFYGMEDVRAFASKNQEPLGSTESMPLSDHIGIHDDGNRKEEGQCQLSYHLSCRWHRALSSQLGTC